MADKSTNNIELKVLVDKESNKVIFIEPKHDFVDVLFSFMTIPMGTIIRLARKHSDPMVIGCMNNLYESVENIDEQEFLSRTCKDMLLRPTNAADSHCNCLKLKLDDATPRHYFKCSSCNFLRYDNEIQLIMNKAVCPCRKYHMQQVQLLWSSQVGSVFVKEQTRFTVTDDLQLIPPSASTNSAFTKIGVIDVDATEELTINIGTVEMLNLLMSSLVSKTPLTETLLKPKQEPKLSSSKVINQAIHIESQMFGDSMNDDEERKISVKLVVSKSKKMVCYAEAGEDFVSLLFSFLTLPLGFISKNMKDGSLRGCICHLYKAIQDLDGQYMISNHHNEMILNPKLVPGFCHKNSLLGIEETSYYFANNILTTDRSLCSSEPMQLKVGGDIKESALGFLKGPAMFVVTDNLVVRPISRILELHVLKDLNVPVTDLEDQIVHVGKKEALHLLLASFLCDSVLTNTFVGDLREPKQEQ